MKYFTYVIIGIVAIAIVAGFFLVGSPQEKRLQRFDDQRVQDLSFLQNQIVSYWQSKSKLPANLLDLKDDIRGIAVPHDPQTGGDYGYEAKGAFAFSLCADFVRSTQSQTDQTKPVAYDYYGGNWRHGAGHVCFDRTIDKDIYKPRTDVPPLPELLPLKN